MKLTCTRENLANSLDQVSGVVDKNPNLPILKNILIEVGESKVELTATNLELTVKSTFRAKVEEQGEFTVPASTLKDYIHLLNDEKVEIELEGNELSVTCGTSSTKIKGEDPEEYPVIPEVEEKFTYSLLAEPFRQSLKNTEIAVAQNEIRPELSGVFFGFFGDRHDGLVLAATDSYRLAEKKMSVAQGEDELECIVPGSTVSEMARLISNAQSLTDESQVRISFNENQMIMRYGDFELSSRLVEGDYPDYAEIIPDSFSSEASFPVDVMIQKIRAASLFTTAGVNSVEFILNSSDNNIEISSDSTQKGEHEDQVEADITGEDNSILLNHRYVLDGLQNMSEEVEFKMNSSESPCLFKEEGKSDYKYIVMPIRE
ncbi:MAG: DNA polymerase III subunit beta [Candidatus Magasanikbacteria bacterium]